MLKRHLLIFFSVLFLNAFSQETVKLSELSEISIVTSGAGDNLYEKFGHTAIRVKDPALQLDVIYNYGIFDFDDPNFYLNFTKGYMKYKLAYYPFYLSLKSAQEDKRWVKQQVLNLSTDEKNTFFTFLNNNALPKNASYLYDPFFNNCATKPRDIINTILNNKIIWTDDFTSDISLRQLMNNEINQNTWGSVGINLALGNRLDKKATLQEYLYLPDYVFSALASAKINKNGTKQPLVSKTETLLDFKEKSKGKNSVSPILVFSFLLLFGGFITFKDYKNNKRTKWFDFILFFVTGVLGLLIVFLWFFTNHSTAPNNFNVLWAFPINILIAFYVLSNNPPKWIRKYVFFLVILLLLIPIVWLSELQLFNWTLFPLFILVLIRYLFLQKALNR